MEFLEFGMHRNLLRSVIRDQAGTLTKALMEGVMNSVDAGARRISITLDATQFVLEDDGRGIQTRADLEACFQHFGTPQTEEKTYGRYRMGRGQLFAFAANVWETGPFRMIVDINNTADLGFHLEELPTSAVGCRVTGRLYRPLEPQALAEAARELAQGVAYVEVPVFLNGEKVSEPPTSSTWDLETDDGYFLLSPSSHAFKIYNRGVFVTAEYASRIGTGGVFVSKRELRVNFARNQILEQECAVWPRVRHDLIDRSMRTALSAPQLTDEQRSHLCKVIGYAPHDKALSRDFLRLKLLPDITGKLHPLQALLKAEKVAVVKDDDEAFGVQAHRSRSAFVLSKSTLEKFDCYNGCEELLERLGQLFDPAFKSLKVVSLAVDEKVRSAAFKSLNVSDLKPRERLAWDALASCWIEFCLKLQVLDCGQPRVLVPGESSLHYEAWTDGCSQTVLNRRLLRRIAAHGMPDILRALQILVHEQCHDRSDLESHSHNEIFFRKYHDVTIDNMSMLYDVATRIRKEFRRLEAAQRQAAAQPTRVGRSHEFVLQ